MLRDGLQILLYKAFDSFIVHCKSTLWLVPIKNFATILVLVITKCWIEPISVGNIVIYLWKYFIKWNLGTNTKLVHWCVCSFFVKIIFQTLCSDASVHNLDKKNIKVIFTTIAWPLRKPLMHGLFVCSIINFHLSVHLSVWVIGKILILGVLCI